MPSREGLSLRQSLLVAGQRTAPQWIEVLEERFDSGERSALLLADIAYVAWSLVHLSSVTSAHMASKLLALAMQVQEQGSLAQALTDLGIIVYGVGLPLAVERLCVQYHIEPAWNVHICEEGGGCPTTIEHAPAGAQRTGAVARLGGL